MLMTALVPMPNCLCVVYDNEIDGVTACPLGCLCYCMLMRVPVLLYANDGSRMLMKVRVCCPATRRAVTSCSRTTFCPSSAPTRLRTPGQ